MIKTGGYDYGYTIIRKRYEVYVLAKLRPVVRLLSSIFCFYSPKVSISTVDTFIVTKSNTVHLVYCGLKFQERTKMFALSSCVERGYYIYLFTFDWGWSISCKCIFSHWLHDNQRKHGEVHPFGDIQLIFFKWISKSVKNVCSFIIECFPYYAWKLCPIESWGWFS